MANWLQLLPPAVAAAFLCLAVGIAPRAGAAPQSKEQRKCVTASAADARKVARKQDKAAVACLHDAARGRADKLGPGGTALACVQVEPKGQVQKAIDALVGKEAKRCAGAALPDFSYAPAAEAGAAARSHAISLVHDLFGPDLDPAIRLHAIEPLAARCQEKLLKEAQALFDVLRKRARTGTEEALKGRKRAVGSDPFAQARSRAEVETELIVRVDRDAKGKIAGAEAKLAAKAAKHCARTEAPVGDLFPGRCAGAADPAALATCLEEVVHGRFWGGQAETAALAIPCDLVDDGTFDQSCAEPALVEHVLARTGYGHDAWSRARVEEIGVAAYLREQLDPASIVEDPALDAALAAYPSLAMDFNQLRAAYPRRPEVDGGPRRSDVPRALEESTLLRRIVTRRQLEAVLVDFWFNHLNVDGSESRRQWDTTPYVRDVIRPHVLGRFADMFIASAESPAMGDYLDNRRNVVGGINENYSREAMELHSLSVAGPFEESDVVEAARVLTGWGVDYDFPGGFRFRDGDHDFGAKTVLGQDFPSGVGVDEGIALLEMLALHESTARFLATKLARRFVAEDPPDALVRRVAQVYLDSGGHLGAVLEELLLSPEFLLHTVNRRSKVKRPSQLWISLARVLGADPAALNLNRIRREVRDLGEPLFAAPPPTGFPDVSPAWAGPGALVERINEVERVAEGDRGFSFDLGIDGAGSSASIVDGLVAVVFPGGVSSATRAGAVGYADALPAGSEGLRTEEALAFLLSSPEFLLH
jgi:hypothetical protein